MGQQDAGKALEGGAHESKFGRVLAHALRKDTKTTRYHVPYGMLYLRKLLLLPKHPSSIFSISPKVMMRYLSAFHNPLARTPAGLAGHYR